MVTKIIFILTAALFLSVNCAKADLKTLMEVGKSQADIARAMKKETISYKSVKKAIESNKIKEGLSAGEIKKKYGAPIIETFDKNKNTVKWLYMPAESTHFAGEKIYIYVTSDGKVAGWQMVEK